MKFKDNKHEVFYIKETERLNADTYLKSLIYTIGICPTTRTHWKRIYDESKKEINLNVISEGWQTGTSVKVTRLAFNLFNGGVPTAVDFENDTKDFEECCRYSVSNIFCCEYAFYFAMAISIRYPQYWSL